MPAIGAARHVLAMLRTTGDGRERCYSLDKVARPRSTWHVIRAVGLQNNGYILFFSFTVYHHQWSDDDAQDRKLNF
jgi:hypothetical protein